MRSLEGDCVNLKHVLTSRCRGARDVAVSGRWWALLLVGVLALVLLPHQAAAQQQPGLTLEIEAGYDGDYRVSQWFPVTIIASNDGPDIQGEIEWSYPTDDRMTIRRAIDLPRGARKRVTFNALANSFMRSARVRLWADDQMVYEADVRLQPIEAERYVIGVLSSDATMLNSLSSIESLNASGTSIVRFDPALLPENAMALTGIDALFIHDISTADLSDAQRDALQLWTNLGGSLVVSGGVNAEQTVPGMETMLPVEVGALQSGVSLTSLGKYAAAGTDPLPQDARTTANRVTLRPGATGLDTNDLLLQHDYGAGQVIFSAFDVSALRAWQGEPDLWAQVLGSEPNFSPAAAFRWQSNNLLPQVLQLPELDLPPFGVLLLFVIGYVVLIGPLNFFVLRRMRRLELAWLTIPATVMLFVVGTYATSILIRGVTPQVMQVTVVQSFEGHEQSQATSFMGVFSPRRQQYTADFADEVLVSTNRFDNMNLNQPQLLWTDTATELRDILVDVSSLRTFIVEETLPAEVQVSSAFQRDGVTVTGEVRNESGFALEDALLVTNNSVERLNTILPDATVSVSIRRNQDNFPGAAGAETEGLFNRQQMLSTLFNFNGFMGGFVRPPGPGNPGMTSFDPEGVYLLAWREQPAVSANLRDVTTEQQGLTLYVVRLQNQEQTE